MALAAKCIFVDIYVRFESVSSDLYSSDYSFRQIGL